jgi:prepilin-type N-terminal cleavage/methylation domain-containing protein
LAYRQHHNRNLVSPLAFRGFTLAEVLVALALAAFVAAAAEGVLVSTRRKHLAYTERVAMHETLRAGVTVLPAELRGLDAADSDIMAMSHTALTIRAMRQLAFLCTRPAQESDGQLALIVRQSPFFGLQQEFSVGDSVLLYSEGDPASSQDDRWLRAAIIAVSSMDCPDPDRSRPGYELMLAPGWRAENPTGARGITPGSPVRGFTIVTYTAYRSSSDGEWYLGVRALGSVIEPIAGPLAGPGGLTFNYYDGAGALTTTPAAVAEVEIRVRARSALARAMPPGSETDSTVARVALRNNFRCDSCP